MLFQSVGDGRANGIFGHIAARPVIVCQRIAWQRPTQLLHSVCRLPGPHDDLTDTAHRLRIGRHDRECANIMQHIFSGDRASPYAAFGKGKIIGDLGIQMVRHHNHVQMLIHRIAGKRTGRVGRGRQHIGFPGNPDNIGRVPAAGAFGVERMERAAGNGLEHVLDKPSLVKGIGVDRNLDTGCVCDLKRSVNNRRRSAPVFMDFEASHARTQLLPQGLMRHRIAAPQKKDIHGPRLKPFEHALHPPGTRRGQRRFGSFGRP